MKVMKLNTIYVQRIGKAMFWILICFLLIRGIFSIFGQSEKVTAKEIIENYTIQEEYQQRIKQEASAFAESFTYNYYTFNNKEEYEEGLKGYMKTSNSNNFKNETRALETTAYRVNFISENQVDVDVKVVVEYRVKENNEEDQIQGNESWGYKTIKEDLYIRVPIAEKEGRYLVEEMPLIIPKPDAADIKHKLYSGIEIDKSEKQEIEGVLDNFLKAYYAGNIGEIKYYISEDSSINKGIEGRVEFTSIKGLRVYKNEEEGEYTAIVEIMVLDNENEIVQNLKIILTQDKRYYIKTIETRSREIIGNQEVN